MIRPVMSFSGELTDHVKNYYALDLIIYILSNF